MELTNMDITYTNDSLQCRKIECLDGDNDKMLQIELIRRRIEKLNDNIEQTKQQLYDAKRSKARYIQMNDEFALLQEKFQSDKVNNEQKIQSLRLEMINPLKSKNKALQLELQELHKKFSDAIDSLNNQKQLKLKCSNDAVDINSSIATEEDVKRENAELSEQIMLQQETLEDNISEMVKNEEKISFLSQCYEEVKETVETVKNEAFSLKADSQELTDELVLMKSQLDQLNSKPLEEGSRGNNYFGEIESYRIALLEKTKKLKKEYMEIKRNLATASYTLKKQRKESLFLIEKSKKLLEFEVKFKSSNLEEITKLKEKYEALEEAYNDIPIISNEEGETMNEYISQIVTKARNEIKDQRREVQLCYDTYLDDVYNLALCKKKLFDARCSHFQESNKCNRLNSLLNEYKRSEIVNCTDIHVEKSFENSSRSDKTLTDTIKDDDTLCTTQSKDETMIAQEKATPRPQIIIKIDEF